MVDRAEVVPGETVEAAPYRRRALAHPRALDGRAVPERAADDQQGVELRPNQPVVREASQVLPAITPPSQPYWLRTEGTAGLFDVDDPSLIGRAENPPAFPIEYVFDVGGQTLVIAGEPMPAADPANAGAAPAAGSHRAGLAAVRRGRAALRARRRASGDGGAHRRPRARRRHRAARRAGRLDRDARLAAVSTRRPWRARALHLHRDRAGVSSRPHRSARAWRSTAGASTSSASRFATITFRSSSCSRRRAPRRCRSSWRLAAATSATCRAPATTWPPPWSRWDTRSRH